MKAATLRMRKWRKKNRQRQRENDRRWRKNNLSKARAKNREWYKNNKEKEAIRNAEYTQKNLKKIAKRARLRLHGMTAEEHDAKMAEQDNKCAVCRKPFTKTPHIDHDHKCCSTRKTCGKCNRGLTCDDCNLGLGRFKDSIETLSNAIEYLKGWQNGRKQ